MTAITWHREFARECQQDSVFVATCLQFPVCRMTWTSEYDALSNPTYITDFQGQVTRFEYDVLGRLSRQVFDDGTDHTFTYTATNQIATIETPDGNELRFHFVLDQTYQTQGIEGMADKKSQRCAWTVVGKTRPIMETGINNLTEDTASALVHFADGQTQQWLMVRLEDPEDSR